MIRHKRIASLIIAVLMIITVGGGGEAFAYEDKTTTYYDTMIKAPDLGNYKFNITSHEIPSHEWLPIISKDYFPVTVASFVTEVDNTAPSAKYKSKPVTKVDVVFALGELSQMKQLENYMPNFEAKLKTASNSLDAQITSVETVTGGFDMADADAETIYTMWDQYPDPNNYVLQGSTVINVPYAWNGYEAETGRGGGRNRFNQVFIEANSYNCSEFMIKCKIAWHGCCSGSGLIVRYDIENDRAYILMCEDAVQLHKVENVSKYIGHNYESGSCGLWIMNNNVGTVIGKSNTEYPTSGDGKEIKIEGKGNTFIVSSDGVELFTCTDDNNPIERGGLGLWAGCVATFKEIQVAYETTVRKTLGESISEVMWRDDAVRFIVHATDVIPEECLPGREGDYLYTITKLLNSNAYLINLGTSANRADLDKLVEDIKLSYDTQRGTFYYNSPINTALNNSAQWILDKTKNLSKPTDYILVNTEILWDTEYNDYERDVPLNYGGNKDDKAIANAWGIGLTNLYSQDKILAEKWRYRHKNTFYDNSPIVASFDNTWLKDPIEIFNYAGLYRVNYKRRDNPLYRDVLLTNPFDSYRYWSTDYDLKVKE